MNNKYWISLGGCGNNILDSIVKDTILINDVQKECLYVNFSESDIDRSFKKPIIVVDGDGTGRSKNKGKELVTKYSSTLNSQINKFANNGITKEKENFFVNIIASMGGGTGSSLYPFVIKNLINMRMPNMKIIFHAVLSSPKEGVATLPNSIKSFQELYNDFVLSEKIGTCFLYDNRKFEKDYEIGTFEFDEINNIIINHISDVFITKDYRESAHGLQTLDVNEVSRILTWGKGLADMSVLILKIGDELKLHSTIFNGTYKYNKAKAAFAFIQLPKNLKNYSEHIVYANSIIEKIKKKFSTAFFVFGFNLNNENINNNEIEVRIIANGLNFPTAFLGDIKKASSGVQKLKTENDSFEFSADANLDF